MDPIHLQDPFGMAATRIVEAAWTEHGPALNAYLTSLTRDPSAAEDIAQEAFLRLTREVGAGRTPDNIGGWLHRVATNLAMSRARHNQVVDRYAPALYDRRVGGSPEDEVLRRERDALLPRGARRAVRDRSGGRRHGRRGVPRPRDRPGPGTHAGRDPDPAVPGPDAACAARSPCPT